MAKRKGNQKKPKSRGSSNQASASVAESGGGSGKRKHDKPGSSKKRRMRVGAQLDQQKALAVASRIRHQQTPGARPSP